MNTQVYRVLLVEDVPMIAKITEKMLRSSESNRYTTVHKTRLSDALQALKS